MDFKIIKEFDFCNQTINNQCVVGNTTYFSDDWLGHLARNPLVYSVCESNYTAVIKFVSGLELMVYIKQGTFRIL